MIASRGIDDLERARKHLLDGERERAVRALERLESGAGRDHLLLRQIGELYAHSGQHADSCRVYERAAAIVPGDPRVLYDLAAAQVAVGRLIDAERNLDRVVAQNPHDYDAWYNRSTLRRQTPRDNHIAALSDLLESGGHGPGEVPLCYALAREHEDLGDFETSFEYLKRGADRRRSMMAYRVEHDVAVMQRLVQLFDLDWAARIPAAPQLRGPLFVMGLPRSGTTLVDRILSSHSRIESLGEINDFALCLARLAGAPDKARLLEASTRLDMTTLGERYLASIRRGGGSAELLIDKTPANYLYLGLIARSLPGAAVVHVRRHPLDSCLAMYRTLFRMGYPFSYNLDDLARYYVAWHRLMQHWRRVFADSFIDVAYEDLVEDPATVSRRLIDHCGVDWEEDCLRFDRNTAPAATASAAQVRQPIYRDSLGRWRRYERQLAPLARALADAGIAV